MTIKNLISIYMYNDFCINIFDNKIGQKENINDYINLIKNKEAYLLDFLRYRFLLLKYYYKI